jgi:hypothetical protein
MCRDGGRNGDRQRVAASRFQVTRELPFVVCIGLEIALLWIVCAPGCVSRACVGYRFRFYFCHRVPASPSGSLAPPFGFTGSPLLFFVASMAVGLHRACSHGAHLRDAVCVRAYAAGLFIFFAKSLCQWQFRHLAMFVAISSPALMFGACSGCMPNPCAGLWITGMGTSSFVTPISPTRSRMRPSSELRNWVSTRPPPCTGFSFSLRFPLPTCWLAYCVVADVRFLNRVLMQVSWFGEDTAGPTPHPTMLSVRRAWSCFPSSKCIADGSCRRTARICIL